MFTEEVLNHLSYKCECPLDIKKDLGVVNGICPNHPDNKLLFDGMDLNTYKAFLESKKKKLAKTTSEVV